MVVGSLYYIHKSRQVCMKGRNATDSDLKSQLWLRLLLWRPHRSFFMVHCCLMKGHGEFVLHQREKKGDSDRLSLKWEFLFDSLAWTDERVNLIWLDTTMTNGSKVSAYSSLCCLVQVLSSCVALFTLHPQKKRLVCLHCIWKSVACLLCVPK